MNYNEILAAARDCVGPYCRACPICNGRACGNTMPGPGCKSPGLTASRNYDKWQEICVNMDTLCPNAEPDLSFELFGRKFSAPIFAAPLGALDMHYGPKYRDQEYNAILIKRRVVKYDHQHLLVQRDKNSGYNCTHHLFLRASDDDHLVGHVSQCIGEKRA